MFKSCLWLETDKMVLLSFFLFVVSFLANRLFAELDRFIRPDEDPNSVTWESRLARAYESKLFKEYALVDLKHFKSRRVALRWRTAEEVIGAVGENTCGSIRCAWHLPLPIEQQQEQGWGSEAMRVPKMKAFELPFAYEEDGQKQTALVKVKVCERCERKLVYRPGKEKEENGETQDEERERRRSMSHHSEADDRSDGQRRPRSSSLSRSRYAKEADSRVKFDRGIHRRGSASPRPR